MTASGKTVIAAKLRDKYGYKKLVTYTTRAPRAGEVNGIDYWFISEAEFLKLKAEGFFAETKVVKMADGEVYYGTSVDSLRSSDKNTLAIWTPDGIREMLKIGIIQPVVVLIRSDIDTIMDRLEQRGDKYEDLTIRVMDDLEAFSDLTDIVTCVVDNDRDTDLEECAYEIHRAYQRMCTGISE